jgi:hypothetical protein
VLTRSGVFHFAFSQGQLPVEPHRDTLAGNQIEKPDLSACGEDDDLLALMNCSMSWPIEPLFGVERSPLAE